MLKRMLAIILSGVMILSTGCGLSSGMKDKLFGDADVTELVRDAVRGGNFELLDEFFDAGKISESLLNDALNSAVFAENQYESMVYLLERGADPNTDNIIWDLAFNARVDAMRGLLTSDKIVFTKKNEVGNDALYMALENNGGGSEYSNYQVTKLLIDRGVNAYPELFKKYKTDNNASPYGQLLSSPYSSKYALENLLSSGQKSGLPKACELAILGETENAVEECVEHQNDYTDDDVTLLTTFLAYWGTPEQCDEVCNLYDTHVYEGMLKNVVQTNNAEMLDYIVKANNIDLSNFYYVGALEAAASFDNFDACKYLCENNVFIAVNKSEEQASSSPFFILRTAVINNNLELFKLIYNYVISCGGKITEEYLSNSLGTSLTMQNKEIIDFLTKEGFVFSKIDVSGSDLDTSKYLEKCGKVLDGIDLINSVRSENVDVVKYLLGKNVDINYADEFENTALKSSLSGKSEILELLIVNGVIVPDRILENCASISKKNTKILIDNGANTKIKFDKIKTLNGSLKSGDFDLKDYWEAYGRDDLVELL